MTLSERIGFWVIVAGVAVMGLNVAYYWCAFWTLKLRRRFRLRQQTRWAQWHREHYEQQQVQRRGPVVVADDGHMH